MPSSGSSVSDDTIDQRNLELEEVKEHEPQIELFGGAERRLEVEAVK
jgi:hypothetical protein